MKLLCMKTKFDNVLHDYVIIIPIIIIIRL